MIVSTPPPVSIDVWTARCLRRLRLAQFLETAAALLSGTLLGCGAVVIVVKLLAPQLWPHALWVTTALVPAMLAAWWLTRRSPFTTGEAVAVLDSRLQAGGLLLALSEAPDAEWQRRLPQMEALWRQSLPRVRPYTFARRTALPAMFAVAAGLVPERAVVAEPPRASSVGQQAAVELQELVEQLEEEELLEPVDQQKIQDEIDRLLEESEQAPLTHEKWETVDALRERLRLRVDEAEAGLETARAAVRRLAEVISGDAPELSTEHREELFKQIRDAVQRLKDRGGFKRMDADLADRLQRLMKSESLTASGDAEDNSQLLSELDEFLQSEAARLSELRSACDGQGGNCAPCVDGCRCRGPADAACACSHCCRSRSSPRAAGRKPGPGQGAVSRGRGEAPLTWGDEATDQNIRFRESILPAGSDETPTDQIIGITAANPDDELTDAGPRSAAQRASAVSGDQFWRRVIRPRHRSVVRGYFDSVPTPDTRQ